MLRTEAEIREYCETHINRIRELVSSNINTNKKDGPSKDFLLIAIGQKDALLKIIKFLDGVDEPE